MTFSAHGVQQQRADVLWFHSSPRIHAVSGGNSRCFFPKRIRAALCLTILTMLCWGSWANTLKLCPGYRFQLFYWDYAIGMAVGAIFWGLTAGSMGHAGTPFLADRAADGRWSRCSTR